MPAMLAGGGILVEDFEPGLIRLFVFNAAINYFSYCCYSALLLELTCEIFLLIDFLIASRSIKDWCCLYFLGIEEPLLSFNVPLSC